VAAAATTRVYLRSPRPSDGPELIRLNRASRRLHGRYMAPPRSPSEFAAALRRSRRPNVDVSLVRRRADDAIVGVIVLSEIVHGNLQSAYMGYYVGAPFGGQGYMTEGLTLVLRRAFGPLGLHRVEANIQPGNEPSIRLVKRLGFTREGFSRRYLRIAGRWRDHERWAILAEDWRKSQRARSRRPPSRARR
jgi:[ribosomal protein S5]-alanine N-acetyltransferase